MTVDELSRIIEPYIEEPIVDFVIERQIFSEKNGKKKFNDIIREKTQRKSGVYLWIDKATDEIVYIGMAGKIKTNGTPADHTIQNRLLASRGKNKATKKYIQTNDYIHNFMDRENISALNFCVMYSKKEEPAAYIEALLLYKFYKKNNRLPKLNNSF